MVFPDHCVFGVIKSEQAVGSSRVEIAVSHDRVHTSGLAGGWSAADSAVVVHCKTNAGIRNSLVAWITLLV